MGVLIVLDPQNVDFNPHAWLMVLAALMFAFLDIINKKFIVKETMLGMLFYSALFTSLLGFYPAYSVWVMPSTNDMLFALLLGVGSNIILYCLLKAFSLIDVSSTAPYRYLEIIISAIAGYFIFSEVPQSSLYLGGLLIIPSTLYIAYKKLALEKES